MNYVIHKIALEIGVEQDFKLPKGAVILTTQVQKGIICIWYSCNTDAEEEVRTFLVTPTGVKEVSGICNHIYIGTVQLENGDFIGHVFEYIYKRSVRGNILTDQRHIESSDIASNH